MCVLYGWNFLFCFWCLSVLFLVLWIFFLLLELFVILLYWYLLMVFYLVGDELVMCMCFWWVFNFLFNLEIMFNDLEFFKLNVFDFNFFKFFNKLVLNLNWIWLFLDLILCREFFLSFFEIDFDCFVFNCFENVLNWDCIIFVKSLMMFEIFSEEVFFVLFFGNLFMFIFILLFELFIFCGMRERMKNDVLFVLKRVFEWLYNFLC